MSQEQADLFALLKTKTGTLNNEVFIQANYDVYSEIARFLCGQANLDSLYNPASWTSTSPNSIEALEEALQSIELSNSPQIIRGKPFYKNSYIPNVIGLITEIPNPIAIKIGHIESIQSTVQALSALKSIIDPNDLNIQNPEYFQLNNTRLGMMVSPFISGKIPTVKEWRNNIPRIKPYVQAKIDLWIDSINFSPMNQATTGFCVYDALSDGNCLIDDFGKLHIIDADCRHVKGKANKAERWISGAIASDIVMGLSLIALQPNDLGMQYNPAAKKLEW